MPGWAVSTASLFAVPLNGLPPGRRRVLEDVVSRLPVLESQSWTRVAIDGVDGAGKTTFADQLASCLQSTGREVIRVSADDFHHVRAVRYQRGRDSPEGFWLDSYDYAALRRSVLDPLRPGGSGRYRVAAHDLASDRPRDLPWQVAPAGAVLVVDGLFLHRDELAGSWDLSVFLQVPFAVSVARLAERDGSPRDPEHPRLGRYVRGQQLYFAACRPWERADLVIDNTDADAPTLLQATRRS